MTSSFRKFSIVLLVVAAFAGWTAAPVQAQTLYALSPTGVPVNSATFTLTITGLNFAQGQLVTFGSNTLSPNSVTSTQLTVVVPGSLLTTAQTVSVSVGGSNALTFIIGSGGSGGLTITCTPTQGPASINSFFTQSCTVSGGTAPYSWSASGLPNGISLVGTTGTSTTISGTPSTAQSYSYVVQVSDSSPTRLSGTLTITGLIGSGTGGYDLTSLSPASAIAGSGGISISVFGDGFTASSVVYFSGNSLSSTLISSNQLSALIPSNYLASAGTATVTVITGGVSTNGLPFTIGSGSSSGVTLYSISPTSTPAGTGFTLTFTGLGFVPGQLISISGASGSLVVPSNATSTSFSLFIPGDFVPSAGVVNVSVGGSNTLQLTLGSGSSTGGLTINCTPAYGPSLISTSFSQSCTVGGGSGSYTWTVSGLPAGLTQANTTGQLVTISGTPNTAQSYVYNIQVSDTAGHSATQSYTGTIGTTQSGYNISSLSPSSAVVGSSAIVMNVYGAGFTTSSLVYFNGLQIVPTFINNGQLQATIPASSLTVASTANVNVITAGQATNTLQFTIGSGTSGGSLSLTCSPGVGPATLNTSYTTTCTVSGGTQPYSWSTTGGFPSYLTLSPTGATATISGTPNFAASYNFAAKVTDSSSPTQSASLQFAGQTTATSTGTGTVLISSITPTSAPTGSSSVPLTINGSGFTSASYVTIDGTPLVTTFVSDTQLKATIPSGQLTFSHSSLIGVVTPGIANSNSVSFSIGSGGNTQMSISCTNGVGPAAPGAGYATTCTANGGTGPYTWAITSGTLPAGLTLTPNGVTSSISGTTTFSGVYSYTLQVTDSSSPANSGIQVFAGATGAGTSGGTGGLSITSISPNSSPVGATATVLTVNGSGFPTGAVINFNGSPLQTNFISSTQLTATIPTTSLAIAQTASITVSSSGTLSNAVSFTVGNASQISISCNPTAGPPAPGSFYSTTCTATGGAPPYAWSLAGVVPSGLALSGSTSATVIISGVTFLNGSYQYALQITDSSSPALQGSYTFSGVIGQTSSTGTGGTITSVSPISTPVGTGPITVQLTGSGFQNGVSTAYWNQFTLLPTTYVSPTQLTITIPASLLTSIGTGQISVSTPGLGLSNSVGFFVTGAGAIAPSPASLTFTYGLGGTIPPAQTVTISSSVVNFYSVTYSGQANGVTWLVPGAGSGAIPGTLTVNVAPGSLPVGTYNGSITITGSGVGTSATIPVTLNVVGPPTLVSSVKSLTFTSGSGTSAPTQTVNITSSDGTTILPYNVSVVSNNGGNWLSVTANSGSTPGSFTVTANAASLTPSSYSGTITVATTSGVGSQIAIPVSFTVTTAPNLTASPTTLSFSAQSGAPAPPGQTLSIAGPGGSGSYNFTVTATTTSGGSWLSTSPTTGTTPGTVTVSVGVGSLGAGTYNGTLTITPASGSNIGSTTVPVSLTVTGPPPTISVAPQSLTFNAQGGGSAPPSQNLQVTATNGVVANYTVSTTSTGNWLSATASGTTPGTVTVSVNQGSLALGQYTGSLTITAPGATNGPQTIPVTLNVTTAPSVFAVPSQLTFLVPGDGSTPAPQTVTIVSSGADTTFTASAVAQGGNWLTVNGGGSTPGNLTVTVNPAGLAAGQTYNGSITVNAPGSTPNSIQIPVVIVLAPQGAVPLQVVPSTLYLSYTQGAGTDLQHVVVLNSGGGTVSFTAQAQSQSCGNWLSLVNSAGTAAVSSPGVIGFNVSPSGLTSQTCRATLTINDSNGNTKTTPVVMAISAQSQSILLSQTAMNFQAAAGGTAPASQTFQVLNPGSGSMSWNINSTTLSGGSWLTVAPNTGSAQSLAQAGSPISVSVNPQGLSAGTYYGTVQVSSPGANNGPQSITVALTVLSSTTNPSPQVMPNGVILTGSNGSSDMQTVTVTNPGANAVTFSSVVITDDGQSWLTESPASGTIPAGGSTSISLAMNTGTSGAGLRHATLRLVFSDGSVQTVDIQLAISGTPTTTIQGISPCGSTNLPIEFLSPTQNFQATSRVAVPVQVLVKDCAGNPLSSSTTGVDLFVGSTNADIRLNYIGNGIWTGNWTPSTATVVESLTARALQLTPTGIATGAVTSTGFTRAPLQGAPPYVAAVVNAGSFLWPGLVAPGAMVSVFGSGLADSTTSVFSVPFPNSLAGAQFTLGGSPLPLFYASDGQVNAVIPIGLSPNERDQLIVVRDTTQSVPVDLVVADSDPGIFATNQQGTGQGSILLGGTGQIVAPEGSIPGATTGPATAGQYVSIFVAGLGAVTNPPADGSASVASNPSLTTSAPVVTIGGVQATVSYSGLAPGEVGLYQVNVQVPAGVPTGDAVPVVITMGNGTSNTVTIALK